MSDRVAFLRKSYGLLGGALIVWAAASAYVFRYMPEVSFKWSRWALTGYNWFAVIGLLIGSGMLAQWLARSETSRTIQYIGLGVEVAAWTFLMQPMLWVLFMKFKPAGAQALLAQGTIATLAIFVGLTATVFITKKDFSFLRGVVTVGMFAALGIIMASILFGFTLGLVFTGALIALLALKILYDTSLMMNYFPPTHYVSAALMLFGTVATLFWNIMVFLMRMRSD
ncbi:MAG TPA: Bax inhibitor-1 family protein [Kofleriaceae bacterium]|nr:Bax inhibitor-1 family protein [Kofleriaceae bacterium]